jgi:hypothetical protein
MTNQPSRSLEADEWVLSQAESPSLSPRNFYADLCELENLQQAYTHIKESFPDLGIDLLTFETVEAEGVENFLKQLSKDLRARTYKPTPSSQLVVQVALKRLLESAFPPAFPSEPQPEKTMQRLAGNIEKGLSRVYAVNISECLDTGRPERLVERASRRIGDPQLIGFLKEVVAAPMQPELSPQGLLTPVLSNIAFEGIDHILQQARALGREGNFHHVQSTRVDNQLVVLSDRDPRYDWIVPAVQKRLREELANLHYDPAAIETQSLDVTCGEPLYFLGFELHWVTGKRGEARVHYQRIKELARRQPESVLPIRRWQARFHPLRFVRYSVNWMGHHPCWQFVHAAYRQVNAIQVGWRHLPITLCPVLLLLFGWRSPVPWLCFLLIFLCNWRWTLSLMRPMGTWAWRHKLDVVLGVCTLGALICLALVIHDLRQPSP